MGTRADFYVGRGKDGEWLGSIAFDGHPDTRLPELVASTEAEYRACVESILASESHATRPEMGWPWPWDDSRTTDYSYAWDGEVWCCCFGFRWRTRAEALVPVTDEEDDEEVATGKQCAFPDMSARQAVTFGARSGLLIFGVPK